MARPVKHTAEAMLDATRDIIVRSGPVGVTARAVAVAIDAPSGSVYHRFPRRDDLVAATWLRAQQRFADAFSAAALGGGEAAVAAAESVLTWTQRNPGDAAVLMRHSLRDLLRSDISPDLSEDARRGRLAVTGILERLADHHQVSVLDITLAVVDIPYSVVRRAYDAGRMPTPAEVAAVRRACRLLTGSPSRATPR